VDDSETSVDARQPAGRLSVSERVVVLVDGRLLSLFQYSTERLDAHVSVWTAFGGHVVQPVERSARHRDADLVEDLSQLYVHTSPDVYHTSTP